MAVDPLQALSLLFDRLLRSAAQDAELRGQLRDLAAGLLEALGEEPVAADAPAAANEDNGEATGKPVEPPPPRRTMWTPFPELTLGRGAAPSEPVVAHVPRRTEPTDSELPQIAERCRLKAEGARWAAKRRRLLREGASYSTEIEPLDREIIARAKALPECFLWMNHPDGPAPADLKRYEDVAGCFDALADAVTLVSQMRGDPTDISDSFEDALNLLAEAQSALRAAVVAIDGPSDGDRDQMRVFHWLKATASANQMFLQKFMRANEPADATQWADLTARIESLDSNFQESRARAKNRRRLLGKVRHKASLIARDTPGAQEEWSSLVETVDQLIRDGLPPSNRELREALAGVVEGVPEGLELPEGFQLVMREIDRYIANSPPTEPAPSSSPSAEVQQVRRLLEGRTLVLIGGERRSASCQALKDAFGLEELHWIGTREHQSIDAFEPYVARPEVAVVLLAIRWASHSYGEVRAYCEREGKPFVRLPGGYNPNQVAVQILKQCSERLVERGPRDPSTV